MAACGADTTFLLVDCAKQHNEQIRVIILNTHRNQTGMENKGKETDPGNSGTACSIEPWLSVRDSARALNFYKAAFGAGEVFLLEDPGGGGLVANLSINGATFWIGEESPQHGNFSPASLGGGTVRIILTVADPDHVFARALGAGASQVFPVGEEYGWKLGRLKDPFGHDWEIGHPLETK